MSNERELLIQSAMFDADHLATCAERLLKALNDVTGAEEGLSVAEMGDVGAIERAQNRLNEANESRGECWRAVQGAVYEYRKRAERVRASTTIQDDVRKDAERFVAWFSSNKICDAIPHDFKMLGEEPTLDQWREAIDKARE